MQQQNNIDVILILALLLVLTNLKAIVMYITWLRFKIRIYFKQLENEHNNQTHSRPRELRG